MKIKVYAPYMRFKYQHMKFPKGFRYCSKEEVNMLKKAPHIMGEIKLGDGKVLNPKPKPKKKKTKKK